MHVRVLLFTALAVCLVGLVAACGGDGGKDTTPSPTASAPRDLSPQVGGVEAARRYLLETGIDGRKGDFTKPRSCAEIGKDAEGEYCVHEAFSVYAPGLVILRVADKDDPLDDVWEMRLSLIDKAWQVNSVQPFGAGD